MAGGEHEPIVRDRVDDVDAARVDDARALDAVGEPAVRHAQLDAVAARELVDVAERGAVRGAVASDADGPALAGQRRAAVVAGPGAQLRRPSALDDHRAQADRRDTEAAERVARPRAAGERSRPERQPAAR